MLIQYESRRRRIVVVIGAQPDENGDLYVACTDGDFAPVALDDGEYADEPLEFGFRPNS